MYVIHDMMGLLRTPSGHVSSSELPGFGLVLLVYLTNISLEKRPESYGPLCGWFMVLLPCCLFFPFPSSPSLQGGGGHGANEPR